MTGTGGVAGATPDPRPATLAAVALLFLGIRVLILYARAPFFDEIFTVWMARQPFGRIAANLLHDSGPPLYYFVARLDSVRSLRLLSLLFASVQFALVVRRSLLAGALLALYPPAALVAVDARAYALCALFVTIGVLALDRDKPLFAALAFVLAAHTHYYGVLFFPLLLLRRQFRAFILACVLFIPGFILAIHQPVQATKWNREPLFAPLTNLSFAGIYPDSLFAPAPLSLIAIALVVLVVALWRSPRFAAAVVVPLGLVMVFHIAGRPVYFPMRFESVIAAPLMLWLASSLSAWTLLWRRVLSAALIVIGAISIHIGVDSHLRRERDPYREVALALRRFPASEPVVATGYCYLETVVALDRPVGAWPAEQAEHPGWRATSPPDPGTLPAGQFIWVGEGAAPELTLLRGVRAVHPLFWNERAMIARVEGLTPRLH